MTTVTKRVTETEIAYAIELLDAPGDDEDPESTVVRILMRDTDAQHARKIVRAAIERMART